MIKSFKHIGTRDIWDGVDSKDARRTLPRALWRTATRKLDLINAAHSAADLRAPPGNRLEHLKGDLAGTFSIRINDQYRIVFDFKEGNASNVFITDYH